MEFTDEDKKNFQNSKICHICNKSLPKNSTKIDLLAQIQKWLDIIGLPSRLPTLNAITSKWNHYKSNISDDQFKKAKVELKAFLKKNNHIIVRDHCHWTGKFRGAAHQHCNIMYRRTFKIPCFFLTQHCLF